MVIPREVVKSNLIDPVETTRQLRKVWQITKAYLFGALHDATKRKTTYRIGQKSQAWIELLAKAIRKLGSGAWVYQEGKSRRFWIVEFSKSLLKRVKIASKQDKIDYIRGYFDTEGGVAKSTTVRYYLYFAQKDRKDLEQVKEYLEQLSISCGVTHNPSSRVDPNYWRFFVRAKSYKDFARIIGSAHPEKAKFLRMKI